MLFLEPPCLVIREFLPGDEEVYLNHFNDELVTRHLPKRSRDERSVIFRIALQQYTTRGICGTWGMFNRVDDDFIGSCLLRNFDDDPGTIELGYSMNRKYWGAGIGTEMAKLLVAYGLQDAAVLTIVGVTTLENIGSQRVLEKAGMKRQANILKHGEELAFFKIDKN